jgi:hypothetical protein
MGVPLYFLKQHQQNEFCSGEAFLFFEERTKRSCIFGHASASKS